ncbi:MAG: hypothetical protein Q7T18_05440 [Sedimentisphaerales bacterium]|nr:hypothetical protein [Sedimentisphaerales bacterium]
MSKFKTKRIDGVAAADWPAIHLAAAKHEQAIIEVRAYDPDKEISDQQMKYLHAVVIKEYSSFTGHSPWESEQFLKREAGEQWFMQEIRPEESRRGLVMFECLNPHCRKLFLVPRRGMSGVYHCPGDMCGTDNIRMFFMLSKTELSTKDFGEYLHNCWDFMASINRPVQPPDKAWRENQAVQPAAYASDNKR